MPPKVEVVEWLDAVATYGWHPDDEPQEEPKLVTTVGFVVADEKQFLVIAATWGVPVLGFSFKLVGRGIRTKNRRPAGISGEILDHFAGG